MRRKLILFFGIFLFASGIQSQTMTIRFWAALPEPDHALMAQMIEQYNIRHMDAAIDFRNFDSKALLLEALAKDSPDLALVDSQWVSRFKNKLVPAEDVLSKAGSMVKAVAKADTFKQIWNTGVVDDKAYAIPFSAQTAGLVINLKAFKKAPGVSNLQQLTKAAVAVSKGTVQFAPLVLPLSWDKDDFGKLWIGFVQAVAKPQLKFWKHPAPPSALPFTLYDETAALNLWWNWIYRAKVAPVGAPNHFLDGALWILTDRDVESLHDKFKVVSLPKDKRNWGFLHVDSLVFFGSGKGWDFANFLTDYPMIKLWSMHTPTVPVNKQVYLSPDYLQDIDAHRPWMRVFIGEITKGPSWMDVGEDDLKSVGETLSKTLHNEQAVQESVLKIHETLSEGASKPVSDAH